MLKNAFHFLQDYIKLTFSKSRLLLGEKFNRIKKAYPMSKIKSTSSGKLYISTNDFIQDIEYQIEELQKSSIYREIEERKSKANSDKDEAPVKNSKRSI